MHSFLSDSVDLVDKIFLFLGQPAFNPFFLFLSLELLLDF